MDNLDNLDNLTAIIRDAATDGTQGGVFGHQFDEWLEDIKNRAYEQGRDAAYSSEQESY